MQVTTGNTNLPACRQGLAQGSFVVSFVRIFPLCPLWFGFKTTALVAILFLSLSANALAYKDKKAILVASRDMQADTIGYNIVSEMAKWMNIWLDEGKVKLWDSPEKKYTLSKDDIKRIETSTNTRFTDITTLFVYEYWNAKKRSFRFGLSGFSFTGQTLKGEEILYGYLEYYPGLKELFMSAPLEVNAWGQYGMTLWQALMNKQYDFALVFFDGVAYSDYSKSARFIKYAMDKKHRQLNRQSLKETKLVEYAISGGASKEGVRSVYITDELQKFFNQNPQEFYNYGGDAILSYRKKSPIILTDLHIQEIWVKDKKNISVTPAFVIPYVVGIPTQPIPISEFEKWNFYIEDKQLSEQLLEKNFNYSLKSVNSTEVTKEYAVSVKEALLAGKWSNLFPKRNVQKTQKDE
jgi:hypothetical protein